MVEKMVERINHYQIMLKAARSVIKQQLFPSRWQEDELVNEAWLNSIRRVSNDADDKKILNFSRQSMRQYIYGKRGTKYTKIRQIDNRMVDIDSFYDLEYHDNLYNYDDVDEVVTWLMRLPERYRQMSIMLLHGSTMTEIARCYNLSVSTISQIFTRLRDEL